MWAKRHINDEFNEDLDSKVASSLDDDSDGSYLGFQWFNL